MIFKDRADKVPILHTERLILRLPRLPDFEHIARFYESDRSRWEDGPMSREQAWRIWSSDVASWLLKGFGPFGVDEKSSGRFLGEVGIYQPEGYPEPELGWFVVPEAEGRGIAFEAAKAVMKWAKTELGWNRLVNYIDPSNEKSISLALRLNGKRVDIIGSSLTDVVITHDLSVDNF